jgi:pimeloyl-ACP methyl ester carboxylesterase
MTTPADPATKPKVMRLDPTHSVAYIEVGKAASTLLFIHGSLCDYRYWKPQTDALAQHHRVIAPSLSHYYPRLPSTEGTPFSWIAHVEQVTAFIGHLTHTGAATTSAPPGTAHPPLHLIGHSRGAAIAYQVALRNPDAIQSLTLIDPAGPREQDGSSETTESPSTRGLRKRAAELIAQGAIDAGLGLFVDSTSRPGFWDRSAEVFKNMARDNAATLIMQLNDPLPLYRQAEAQSLELRTLMVTGERSPAVYKENAIALGRFIPNATESTIRGASHGMTWTHSQAFNRELLKFTDEPIGA